MRSSPPSSLMLDSVLPAPSGPALQTDMARMFRHLGVESFRASVVDLASMAYHPAWAMSDAGMVHETANDRALDSSFPGATSVITRLTQEHSDDTITQRLSPRHWVFAWRLDTVHAVLAEARYREPRVAVSPADAALVRMVCNTGMRLRADHDAAVHAVDEDALRWSERGQPGTGRMALALRLGLPLSVLAMLLCAWLALWGLPAARDSAIAQQAEIDQLQTMTDRTLTRQLGAALATGDYGEVQSQLTAFESLGYLRTSAVVNTRLKVVSTTGNADGLRIGQSLPPQAAASARTLPLQLGNERYGQLLLLNDPGSAGKTTAAATPWTALRAAAGTAALAAIGTALLLWRRWQRTAPTVA